VFRRPLERVQLLAQRLDDLQGRAARAVGGRMDLARVHLGAVAGQLESLSPLAVLARGYSLTTRLADGQLARSAGQLAVGESLHTRLAEGAVISRVESVEAAPYRSQEERT
jgi:exodeoxyribonuclease VII large subunit